MIPHKIFLAVLLTCCVTIHSGSQTDSSHKLAAPDVYVGSTPCNSLIKSLLKIPSHASCVFIKWELSLPDSKNDAGAFQLSLAYGDYQPNTMNFSGGGEKMGISGKYTTSYGTTGNSRHKVYHLMGSNGQSTLWLVKMDNNILHFIDSNMKFIEGDGSFGFVLNRIKSEID